MFEKMILSLKLFTGVTADTGVNMCLYHTRNLIAVQTNVLISITSFNWNK